MKSEVHDRAHGGEPPQSLDWVNDAKTWMAMICAPRATPENVCPAAGPLPAAMPATCVPCQQADSEHGRALLLPICDDCPFGQTLVLRPATLLEKHACSTTRPEKNGWAASTPVSRIATTHPLPSKPRAHAWSAPTSGPLWESPGACTSSSS